MSKGLTAIAAVTALAEEYEFSQERVMTLCETINVKNARIRSLEGQVGRLNMDVDARNDALRNVNRLLDEAYEKLTHPIYYRVF